MLKLSEIKRILDDKKWNLSQVARDGNIPYGTLYRNLRAKKPSYFVIERLSDYFEEIGIGECRNDE